VLARQGVVTGAQLGAAAGAIAVAVAEREGEVRSLGMIPNQPSSVRKLLGKLGEPGTFLFNANAHEPGDHALLGKTYPAGGVQQGEAALADIARHDATI